MAFELVCTQCANRHDALRYRLHCERCQGLLDVEYDTPSPAEFRVVKRAPGLRRYAPLLPLRNPDALVTLGEGETPVVPLSAVGRELEINNLSAKLEYLNPTGAFKDRGNAVQVTVLKELGIAAAADIAGGNAGHSFASYCARARIKFVGFAYEDPRHPKLQAIALTGAEMHRVEGDRRACAEAMAAFCLDTGTLNMRYGRNAYFVEGLKTIAYEICEQLDPLPDHIVVPVGNGSVLLGLHRGFKEMLEDGRAGRMPRLHAAQSDACQPLVAALRGRSWSPSAAADSVAVGIQVGEPPRLDALVAACGESGGDAVAVGDDAVLRWQRRLSELEGILVEPTSATVLAAVEELARQGSIGPDERVLVPLTGFGFKEPIPG